MRLAPSLLLAALLVSACASAPSRPPASISTGEPREAPAPQLPVGPDREILEGELGEMAEGLPGPITPPHMAGRDIVRAAVLLPFSHPDRRVREEAQGMLAGIEMALFESAGEGFLLVPKDTAGVQATAIEVAEAAMADGAQVVLGPLFAANVEAVKPVASGALAPVIAFSNDPGAAGAGAYLASITVEEEVTRVVDYAVTQGVDTFVYFGPRSEYGQRAERALRFAAAQAGAVMLYSSFYDPENDAPVEAASAVAEMIGEAVDQRPDSIAVLIPESGIKLRGVAPLLPYYGVDFRHMRLLGTSRWNDPTLWREPTLARAWFAAAPVDRLSRFETRYERIYGRPPSSLASLGYDAAGVAIQLSQRRALDTFGLTDPDGFMGANGLFRFRLDGTAERSLDVLEIDLGEGAVVVDQGRRSFEEEVG